MRVFVTGVCGQLGHDVMAELKKRHYGCVGCDVIDKQSDNYIRLDITGHKKHCVGMPKN